MTGPVNGAVDEPEELLSPADQRADRYAQIVEVGRVLVREVGAKDLHRFVLESLRAVALADGREQFALADWLALVSVALAAVPTGVEFTGLTAWADVGPGYVPHGTQAALMRHRKRREKLCDACQAWNRQRRRAEREREQETTPPPDPWLVDEVAVERACDGEPVKLTKAERLAAVETLLRRGSTRNDIKERLGMGDDSLKGYLSKLDKRQAAEDVESEAA